MEWSRQHQLSLLTAAWEVFVNDGCCGGGMDPTVDLPWGDGTNPTFFGKPVFIDDGRC